MTLSVSSVRYWTMTVSVSSVRYWIMTVSVSSVRYWTMTVSSVWYWTVSVSSVWYWTVSVSSVRYWTQFSNHSSYFPPLISPPPPLLSSPLFCWVLWTQRSGVVPERMETCLTEPEDQHGLTHHRDLSPGGHLEVTTCPNPTERPADRQVRTLGHMIT